MEQRGASEAVVNKAKELERQISTARKCQCVEYIVAVTRHHWTYNFSKIFLCSV